LAIKADLIKLLVAQQDALFKLLRHLAREDSAPGPEYEPPLKKPRPRLPKAGGSWGEMQAKWEAQRLKAEREGWVDPEEEVVSMNDVLRSIPKPRIPRTPEQARDPYWR
jgi:hypothetical protein